MFSLDSARKWFASRRERSLYDRIQDYRPRLSLYFETDDFIVRTAHGTADFLHVLELRHEVFIREWQGRALESGVDLDEYDFLADHLLIVAKKESAVVGTYRLISNRFTSDFYSRGEFDLDRFLRLPGAKLELGRACIHPDFRDGMTIDLLWRGLARYIVKSQARYVFGCSSIRGLDEDMLARLLYDLRANEQWSDEHIIRPTDSYRFDPERDIANEGLPQWRQLLPPLLRSYLHAGAKVHGFPAFDAEFECFDLLTILDMRNLNPRFRTRFFPVESMGHVDLRVCEEPSGVA